MFQFILETSGWDVVGKNANTKAVTRKISAAMFTGKPHLPRENLAGNTGWFATLRQIKHPIEHM